MGRSSPGKRGHQPKAIHAAERFAHSHAHHSQVRQLARLLPRSWLRCARTIWPGPRNCSQSQQFSKTGAQLWKVARRVSSRLKTRLPPSADDTELVAVHDAVRPFIEREVIEKVVARGRETGAAIVGIVPVDTVKQVHRNKVRATLAARAADPDANASGISDWISCGRRLRKHARTCSSALTSPRWSSGSNRWRCRSCSARIATSRSRSRAIWNWRGCTWRSKASGLELS